MEEDSAAVDLYAFAALAPFPRGARAFGGLAFEAELAPYARGGLGHEGRDEYRGEAQRFPERAEHRVEALDVAFASELPRLGLVDVFVGAADKAPERLERVVEGEAGR